MAVFGLSAMLASSAMAEGPLWLVEHRECKEQSLNAVFATQLDCENNENRGSFSPGWEYTGTVLDHLLQKNEMADAKVTNLGVFKLESVINIECQKLSSPTLLLGGTPGKSDTTILFRECK
ncbi:MAG TPA: hypothetical protein VES97_04845, partial [Solirubrobacteraceae bacterium]|nr:hypothetical protein [Solirubrobacteraceae bacterium]